MIQCISSLTEKKLLSYFLELKKLCKNRKIDVIHVHGNSSTMIIELLALKGKAPIVFQAHNTDCVHSSLNKVLSGPFNRMVKHRIACSTEAGKFLFKERSFDVFKNGIDSDRFIFNTSIREKIRKNLSFSIDENVLLHIS